MIKRDSESTITFHCDTPRCSARLPTASRYFTTAERKARARGWAIGTDSDACPEHHA